MRMIEEKEIRQIKILTKIFKIINSSKNKECCYNLYQHPFEELIPIMVHTELP